MNNIKKSSFSFELQSVRMKENNLVKNLFENNCFFQEDLISRGINIRGKSARGNKSHAKINPLNVKLKSYAYFDGF